MAIQVPARLLALTAFASLTAHAQVVDFSDGFEFIVPDEAGTYNITIESVIDPCDYRDFTGEPPMLITIARLGPDMYRMTGNAPWVTLSGIIDEGDTGAASLSGMGTVAGFPNVLCTFSGTVIGGTLAGTVTWGAGNELPSCGGSDSSVKFIITGTRS